jgi:hypothetical protein
MFSDGALSPALHAPRLRVGFYFEFLNWAASFTSAAQFSFAGT